MRKVHLILPLAALLVAGQLPTTGHANSASPKRLETYEPVQAPPAFLEACDRYDWLCDNDPEAEDDFTDEELYDLAKRVNTRVNNAVEHVADLKNNGAVDHWTLPYNGRGDCEDFALQKMKDLLAAGVAPKRLLMAIALYGRGENHAVLILRLDSGDLVLDNLTNRLRSPDRTGYRFLAMQSAADRSELLVALRRPAAEERTAGLSSMTASESEAWKKPGRR